MTGIILRHIHVSTDKDTLTAQLILLNQVTQSIETHGGLTGKFGKALF
jgi:hypothetical protein